MKKKKSIWFLSFYTYVRPILLLIVLMSDIKKLETYSVYFNIVLAVIVEAVLVTLSLIMIYKIRNKDPHTYNYVIFVVFMEFICVSAATTLAYGFFGDYSTTLGRIIGCAIWDICVFFYIRRRKEYLTYSSNNYDIEKKYKCDSCGADVHESDKMCPKCGVKFDEEEKHELLCGNCRKRVKETDSICPRCGLAFNGPKQKELFVCSNCGTKIYKDTQKCPYCGEKFEEESESKIESNIDQKYSDLTKLKELLDKKIITKEEFEKEKKKVLK